MSLLSCNRIFISWRSRFQSDLLSSCVLWNYALNACTSCLGELAYGSHQHSKYLLIWWIEQRDLHGTTRRVLLQFFFFVIILFSFPLILLIAIGEDFVPPILVISSLSVQLPFTSHMYSLIFFISHWTYPSPADSLISVSSLHFFSQWAILFISIMLFYILFSFFFILPFWSVCAGPAYINLVVTTCIPHSQSMQYKCISSLIPSPWRASHSIPKSPNPFERLHIRCQSLHEYHLTVVCQVRGCLYPLCITKDQESSLIPPI